MENKTAMTMPITTRGMAANARLSTKAIINPVATSLTTAMNVARMSPPCDLYGRRIIWARQMPSSTRSMRMTWASPCSLRDAMKMALRKEPAIRQMKK